MADLPFLGYPRGDVKIKDYVFVPLQTVLLSYYGATAFLTGVLPLIYPLRMMCILYPIVCRGCNDHIFWVIVPLIWVYIPDMVEFFSCLLAVAEREEEKYAVMMAVTTMEIWLEVGKNGLVNETACMLLIYTLDINLQDDHFARSYLLGVSNSTLLAKYNTLEYCPGFVEDKVGFFYYNLRRIFLHLKGAS